jgi:hypothetical protein
MLEVHAVARAVRRRQAAREALQFRRATTTIRALVTAPYNVHERNSPQDHILHREDR